MPALMRLPHASSEFDANDAATTPTANGCVRHRDCQIRTCIDKAACHWGPAVTVAGHQTCRRDHHAYISPFVYKYNQFYPYHVSMQNLSSPPECERAVRVLRLPRRLEPDTSSDLCPDPSSFRARAALSAQQRLVLDRSSTEVRQDLRGRRSKARSAGKLSSDTCSWETHLAQCSIGQVLAGHRRP